MKPLIGITIGDQAGIGLEIITKALSQVFDICDTKIIGDIIPTERIVYGKVNPKYGAIAGRAIKKAIDLALEGCIDAIVTAPISKEALNLGGWNFPGHTEMLAHYTNSPNYAMMLVHQNHCVIG